MTRQNQDIKPVYRGNSIEIRATIYDADGNTRDISSDKILFTLSRSTADEPIINRTEEHALVDYEDAENGVLSARLSSEDTESLNRSVYIYHITLFTPNDTATVTTGTIHMQDGYKND